MGSGDLINYKEFIICFSKKPYIIGNLWSISLLLNVSGKSVRENYNVDRGKRSETDRGFPTMKAVVDISKISF